MMKFLACLSLTLVANPVLAQDWHLSDADIPLGPIGAQALTAGRTLTFPDKGESRFSVGGAYSYTYADRGATRFGMFRIESDGSVCIEFRNGFSRCDLFVRNGGILWMLTEQGERFPIKVHLGLRP